MNEFPSTLFREPRKKPRVISASRRTDIPAFFPDWFYNRLKAGFCVTVNPFNRLQKRIVSLKAEDVAAIVFWTRNPRPLCGKLSMLDDRGMGYYFLHTLNGYGHEVEQYAPPLQESIGEFLNLSAKVGPGRIIWRYDPVLLTPVMDMRFHLRNFRMLAKALEGGTNRVIISFFKEYRKTERNLRGRGCRVADEREQLMLAREFEGVAGEFGMQLQCCGLQGEIGSRYGGACISSQIIGEQFGIDPGAVKDPGQPKGCRCISSIDIGTYNTCMFGCRYCYATANTRSASLRYASHDSLAETLA
jgi:hypothetical protein